MSSFPFERTKSPLVMKYQQGLRELLLKLILAKYPEGPINLEVRAKSNFHAGKGRGHLLIDFTAPTSVSNEIIQFCGLSESPGIASQVVRNSICDISSRDWRSTFL
jgi:hypothetical protein